jgi:glycosyltransferase involved in cell wall biosynthesis
MGAGVEDNVMASAAPRTARPDRCGVLLVANLPEGPLVGGVEVGVEMILTSDLKSRHAMHLFNTARRRDPSRPLRERLGYQLRRCVELARDIVQRHPRLVHVKATVGVNYWQGACYSIVARVLRKPTLLQLHGGDLDAWYLEHGRLGRFGIRMCLRVPSEVIVLSEYWRSFVARLAPRQRIRIVPNGVRVDLAEPRTRGSERELRVVTLGALGTRKGHFEILDAIAQLPSDGLRFVFAGEDEFGGEEAELRTRAAELGVTDRVEFVGAVTGRAKWRLLADADVFLLPSRGENMPNAVLEAMAAGLPVVCTSVGALPEMLDAGAIFVPTNDAGAIAAALREIAGDPERRTAMGRANRERAHSRFAFSAIAAALDDLYRESAR